MPRYTYTTYSAKSNEIQHGQTEARDMNDVIDIIENEYIDVYNVKMVEHQPTAADQAEIEASAEMREMTNEIRSL